VLVADVAVRAACADFCGVLADLAVSVVVPEAACDASLARQPFVSWHGVADGGGGMRVWCVADCAALACSLLWGVRR
jgi:hypothetical protein